MTTTQWIFVAFFAIFWGAIASVQGRWKMFHWALIRYPYVARRLVLSIALLDVLPILFFAFTFFLLRNTARTPSYEWTWSETLRQVVVGVVPAFAVFGFYKLWLAAVEAWPTAFYQHQSKPDEQIKGIEPTLDSLNVRHQWWSWNLAFALLYLVVAALVPLNLAH